MARIFFDFEFAEDGTTIEPISVGMVRDDDGATYGAVFDFDESKPNDWVRLNVLPYLEGRERRPKAEIAAEILAFVGPEPEFWGDYCDHDWVLLCQLYGTMSHLPAGWPMRANDMRQLADELGQPDLPSQGGRIHDALDVARHVRTCYHVLRDLQAHRTRHLVQFLDPNYRRALAADLGPVVLSRLGFTHHFGVFGNVGALGADADPILVRAPGQELAVMLPDGHARYGIAEAETALPHHHIGFQVDVSLDELAEWHDDRIVEAAVEQLVTAIWADIEALLVHAKATDLNTALADLVAAGPGPAPRPWALGDEARVKALHQNTWAEPFAGPGGLTQPGDLVLMRPDALVLAYYGLLVREWLDEDGTWHLSGDTKLSTALFAAGARRIVG